MNVLLIAQCDKRALAESRRILDQFAERRGSRTWQTSITQAGLDTLRKLLRKTARRNTAVACHWIRGHDHSELVWIVGDAGRFNEQGAVPTNITRRDVLRSDDENDWHCGQAIYLLSAMAALMHDLGKACLAFQRRLKGELSERNRYRHEWISLRLFQAFVGTDSDEQWLQRLLEPSPEDNARWLANLQKDGLDSHCDRPFSKMPPLASAIGWLILSHHRLSAYPVFGEHNQQQPYGRKDDHLQAQHLQQLLSKIDARWNEIVEPAAAKALQSYWHFDGELPVTTPLWQKQAARIAKRLQLAQQQQSPQRWLDSPYIMHLSRLCLMLADHYYSSLGVVTHSADKSRCRDPRRLSALPGYRLYANTLRATGELNQPLDEHLLGVCAQAGIVSHALAGVERHLPALARHKGLRKRSQNPRFRWQDKAADMALSLRERSVRQGLFVVNMASTGCGKTLANGRIAYALADPLRGARFTVALGLRTLTLQTGQALRERLQLGEHELAVLVGGQAHRDLQEHYQHQAEQHGSASAASLSEPQDHLYFEGNGQTHPLLTRLMLEGRSRQLLDAPLLVCTIDHLMPATESLRGGHHILPMLRLLSSDLILDEPDDFDLADCHALTRLVYWTGLLGRRVILSSATLPPALVEGLFNAYLKGREAYQQYRGEPGTPLDVCCAWVDEHRTQHNDCPALEDFAKAHHSFASKRYRQLAEDEARRLGALVALPPAPVARDKAGEMLAPLLLEHMQKLHVAHGQPDPKSEKNVSFGLIRMANIEPLIEVALALFAADLPAGWRLHLCVYHSQFPLFLRSAIEHRLDSALNRRDPDAVLALADIRQRLDNHPEPQQLFVVLGSPVTEVGRDHDYDWAIAEPSSMRSLIQLAGRIRRHRPGAAKAANLLILDTNIKHLAEPREPAFCRPGYESLGHRLHAHRLGTILQPGQYRVIDARPRLLEPAPLNPSGQLVDLEHQRIRDVMHPNLSMPLVTPGRRGASTPVVSPLGAYSCWAIPHIGLTGVLPQRFPFREDNRRYRDLVFLADDDQQQLLCYEFMPKERQTIPVDNSLLTYDDHSIFSGQGVSPWAETDLLVALTTLATALDMPLENCAKRFATVRLPDNERGWHFHPVLGFRKRR
ncbi:type I-F CRISPR-associated helicase Cas3f [Gallaecimonas pentaromativorans]|uniref:CRISPR-associated Cas3 family helicase n=1 Tax=Gallaecimonas pentaromativorans TaxID=584787 RepID=A0A3N1PFF9_9GAMM|nr:type I-F CRISPR-associated helicase Cas3f [Gallaecimonas pentaromativorans]ROQ25747.1 CRISPR-associated Cas3 family helicase [Gallaecimonas pentaromativorans]